MLEALQGWGVSHGWHVKDDTNEPNRYTLSVGLVVFFGDGIMSETVKYPRTFQLPWSDSNSSDDVWWTAADVTKNFGGKRVVITEKLDGENTNLYRDHYHARSRDSGPHPSRNWVKRLHGEIKADIPEDWRVCGENCYAFHSIFYHLPTYFFVFGVYDEKNMCLSWDDVEQWADLLGLRTVPVIYRGVWNEEVCKKLWTGKGKFPTFACGDDYPVWPFNFEPTTAEGYVVRLEDGFPYEEFKHCAAKYVRENHVQTSTQWMSRPVVPNLLIT